jgi:hypothetical protein
MCYDYELLCFVPVSLYLIFVWYITSDKDMQSPRSIFITLKSCPNDISSQTINYAYIPVLFFSYFYLLFS